mgnify:CR=1 FL=1|tara:strand:- start:9499 stop:10032 length:534 start_codon:yes stop_codon:yes gene_type:complete
MILEETLNKLIRDVVNLLLSSPTFTIKSKPSKRRPTGSYAAVDFISDTGVGMEQRTFENNQGDDDLTENITGMRSIMLSIDFYRVGSVDNARKVKTRLVRESIQELFRAAGVGLTSRSEVREISEALENGWEERAQFDIVLSATGTDSDVVRSILSVDMAAEFQFRGLKYNSIIEVQ